ncbi:type 4b pilus protein PilO2 [Pusillimonas sp. NJUB218]|uniref:type 4b pilus protein PilO2 n=1 Tax=Pusillimonas sp. NJUB218 TaxID=2023230 RepID=UPI000F4D29F5|nr:type 4b pilus protein PilO2 [Pusillimonas sp. NJUB218]ROT44565.1 hypothetical protein CHR62_11030 [Pusillimonas sp. NJUB218]
MTQPVTLFKTVKGVTPIKVGRRILVSGLYWQVLPGSQNYMQEAKKIARRERERTQQALEVVLLRRHTDVVQAGFVVRGGRAKKGTVSLAAVAADSLGATFIAAIALPDGRFALAAALHNAIVPDSDAVFDAQEAQDKIQELWNSLSGSVSAGELVVYAPPELWADATPVALADLLPNIRRSHRLRQRLTLSDQNLATWIVWGLLLVAAAIAWGLWEHHHARLAQERALARAQELERLRGQVGLSASDLSLMRPWTSQPAVQTMAKHCSDAIGQLPLTLDGWVLLNAQCSAKTASASFARTDGRTVRGFTQAAQRWRTGVGVQFSTDGDLGTVDWPMAMPAGGDDPLAPLNMRSAAFMSWWQERLVPFETSPATSTPAPGYAPPPNVQDPKLTAPHWKTMRWSIKSTPRNPTSLLTDFNLPGIRLQEIGLAFGGNGELNWTLKGELYGE